MSANAAAEVQERLRATAARAQRAAPVAAATAAGRAGETMVKTLLSKESHAAGTPTPSPPGSPPAKISGELARSVQRTPTMLVGPGVAMTTWGPTVVYGPVQEYGALIRAKNKALLANRATGQVFGKQVTIPARPYMRPATELLISSGTFTQVQSKAFMAALGL